MTVNIDKIFYPGRGVEIVFNLDSLFPVVRSSIIYDSNHQEEILTISQTTPQILPNYQFDQMSITTLTQTSSSNFKRIGLNCNIETISKNYRLSSENETTAITLRYTKPAFETNIRTAYRLEPLPGFDVSGKLMILGSNYFAGNDFKIHNISITGIGMLVRKKVDNKTNPLLERIKSGMKARLGLILRAGTEEKKTLTPITTEVNTIRTNLHHNPLCGFIGFSFINMNSNQEEKLSKFIHEAQLHKIRKDSGF